MAKDFIEKLTGLKKTKDAKDIKYTGKGARPKGSPKPTKGLYKKRGANQNKTTNVKGGTPGKGTVFKSTKSVIAEKKKKPIRKPNILEKRKSTKTRKEMLDPYRNITRKQGYEMLQKYYTPELWKKKQEDKQLDYKKPDTKGTAIRKKLYKAARFPNQKKSSGGQALVQSLYDKG